MKEKAFVAALLVTGLVATGCSSRSPATQPSSTASAGANADFGSLKNVCQPGSPASSPAQGVTASQIQVGVFTDVGFTKNSEFIDAAKVFTAWCNAAGGINGRKIVAKTHDTKLLEVDQRMLEACDSDFALVGGGAAFDATGVADRLKCLLPDFPAQVVQSLNTDSDLQFPQLAGHSYYAYAGYDEWLLKEAYPDSAAHVGMIVGDSPITVDVGARTREGLIAAGATMAYDELYPPIGVADWSPYAQAIKTKGVKGLVFNGQFEQLAKLEQSLTSINYKLDWIDANSNSYNPSFLQLLGPALSYQNNLADLSGVWPLEKASDNPTTQKVIDLFAQYAPQKAVTLPALRAFSAWLLFAKAAASCGDALTRTCVVTAAAKENAWTGGGLQAPLDFTNLDSPVKCFNIEKATPSGWQPADFKPDTGAYRCNAAVHKLTGNYGKPMTLADVGKTMSDLK
jgi:ABC-type branched-subunit amino acid transport system substrate-binding protein